MNRKKKFNFGGKTFLAFLCIMCVALPAAGSAFGGDVRSLAGTHAPVRPLMPVLGANEYGTDEDNENNAHTGTPDFDMDYYIFNDDPIHPIEFNINIPVDPTGRSATIRMDVYDVDTSTDPGNPEVDEVYVNGNYVGTLNGSDSTWGVNIFDVPMGILRQGNNLVEIHVDVNNPGNPNWAVEIDWGIIKLSSATGSEITRAWFTPVTATRGNYINAFAEISDPAAKVATVRVLRNGVPIFTLSDPDGDSTWSGQYKVPKIWEKGWAKGFTINAYNASGAVVAKWPGIKIQ